MQRQTLSIYNQHSSFDKMYLINFFEAPLPKKMNMVTAKRTDILRQVVKMKQRWADDQDTHSLLQPCRLCEPHYGSMKTTYTYTVMEITHALVRSVRTIGKIRVRKRSTGLTSWEKVPHLRKNSNRFTSFDITFSINHK